MNILKSTILVITGGITFSSCSIKSIPPNTTNPGYWYGEGWSVLEGTQRNLYSQGFDQGRRDAMMGKSFNPNRGNIGIGNEMRQIYRRGYDAGRRSIRNNPYPKQNLDPGIIIPIPPL